MAESIFQKSFDTSKKSIPVFLFTFAFKNHVKIKNFNYHDKLDVSKVPQLLKNSIFLQKKTILIFLSEM